MSLIYKEDERKVFSDGFKKECMNIFEGQINKVIQKAEEVGQSLTLGQNIILKDSDHKFVINLQNDGTKVVEYEEKNNPRVFLLRPNLTAHPDILPTPNNSKRSQYSLTKIIIGPDNLKKLAGYYHNSGEARTPQLVVEFEDGSEHIKNLCEDYWCSVVPDWRGSPTILPVRRLLTFENGRVNGAPKYFAVGEEYRQPYPMKIDKFTYLIYHSGIHPIKDTADKVYNLLLGVASKVFGSKDTQRLQR